MDFNNLENEEELIANYIMQSDPSEYEQIIEREQDIKIVQSLSPIRKNILNWYPFKTDSNCLEIGANFGEVTGALLEKINKVVAIEENAKKVETIKKRYTQAQNLKLIISALDEMDIENKLKTENLENKFDYCIIYTPNLLELALKFLKTDGTILLLTDNRFGISYFAGASRNGRIYDTIQNEKQDIYSKNEIEEKLQNLNLKNYKFYYPLPNYKMPNVIFSDAYMPNENTTKLMYNIMYEKGSVVVFDELKAIKQLTKNKQFKFFANSYLVEIPNIIKQEVSTIKFVSFNNNRKEKYQLATIIEENKKTNETIAKKQMITKKAKDHMKNIELNTRKLRGLGFNMLDEVKNETVISKYIEGNTLDKIIAKYILNGNTKKAYELIDNWYNYIKERLIKNKKSAINENIKVPEEELEGLNILKNGYIDLVFENTFYQNENFYFFDQEWYQDGIPLEYLLYRAINNMYSYNLELNGILSETEIFKRYNLEKYINLFKRIEEFIQKDIINEQMVFINKLSLEKLYDINKASLFVKQIENYKQNDAKQTKYITEIEEDNKNKQAYIIALENKVSELEQTIKTMEEEKEEKPEKKKNRFFRK